VVHDESIAHPDMSGMGTTCTAMVVRGHDVLLSHVGDSRAYLAQGGKLRQLSQDHSLVAQLVRDGQLTSEQARSDPRRNVVTRSVGVGAHVEVDAQRFAALLGEGDTLLMCSDGLHGLVHDDELLDFAQLPTLDEGARRAIAMANSRGGHDNITVILARVVPSGVTTSHVEVDTRGRSNAWADADHDRDRDDVEHTHVFTPAKRPAMKPVRDDEDDDDPPLRASRSAPVAVVEVDPGRKRTMLWLLIALVVLLLAIGAAALVLMQISKQSASLGAIPEAPKTSGAS
jgi:hypothetical protein